MKKIKNTTGVKVNFFPAKLEYRKIKKGLQNALHKVGESGFLVLGPNVKEFESKLAELTNRKYAIGCASGTDAITMSLEALDIKSGDEVIVPANAYPTVFGVALSGATPVLVDVKEETGNLDSSKLKSKISKRTKAVVAVHLYGLPVDIKEIKKICQENKITLIEDCAQSFGATYQEKPIGSFGDIAVFSFYPTKNLGAIGDGGAIVTNKKSIYDKLQMLRMYGEKGRYDSRFIGRNSRLDELQAAFLLAKLPSLNTWLNTRRKLAQVYIKELSKISNIKLPPTFKDREHTYHLFVIKTKDRDALREWLITNGIDVGIHYPKPIHFTKTFSYCGQKGSFPQAEKWSQLALSLPMHPFILLSEIRYVAKVIRQYYNGNSRKVS